MTSRTTRCLTRSTALLAALALSPIFLPAQTHPQAATQPAAQPAAHPPAVLVELFTSEGCSDCPPADDLLRQVAGTTTPDGMLIVGLSEHVTYWNGLGWSDPFSSDLYTRRQQDYGTRFALNSVYTPQMVVNGRRQFVGSNHRALTSALEAEAKQHQQIDLRITSAELKGKSLTLTYSAAMFPPNAHLQLMVAFVDDALQSHVLRGENSGRNLVHASVARALAPLGPLAETANQSLTLPLPPGFLENPSGHHVVLFAQQINAGPVLGTDSRPI